MIDDPVDRTWASTWKFNSTYPHRRLRFREVIFGIDIPRLSLRLFVKNPVFAKNSDVSIDLPIFTLIGVCRLADKVYKGRAALRG